MLSEIVGHFVAGGLCFLALIALALATDYAGLSGLLQNDPGLAAALILGALISFAPVVFCIAIGCVRRGEQSWTWRVRSDEPSP